MTRADYQTDTLGASRFSFIIPAYNVAAYIGRCLESLLRDPGTDYEVIVVNDGSTDETATAARHYSDNARLSVIDQANAGPGAARNTGIDRARGRYLMFVDGDDWIEPDTLNVFRQTLAECPECDLMVFGFYEVYGSDRHTHDCVADFWKITNSPCNKLFRSDLFDGLRFDPTIWYEDLAIVPCLFARARRPETVPRYLYNYQRDRESSIMNTVDYRRVFDLPLAARRCVSRIRQDEASGRIAPTAPRFGADWERRFLTIEIYIVGVLHRSIRITDRRERRAYIDRMMELIPDRSEISPSVVRERYGCKMALGSWFYRTGHTGIAHFILHDTGAAKRRLLALFQTTGE
ncbi:glycosyltransferase family A protein [Salinisphaera sp. LB1]|uniref:glycosyltransferase family 2 protein n=1 Tax=Salinisphaera sp. LB1 TaxID=2183911 RepID=UPI000D707940|nr:glycosyltransferase family A protein [Salinisphaera sp. LB1]AWN14288.1 glycosyltransferase [Salinisphaera sp. LB1]